MLRFDYHEQENETVEVRIVSEEQDKSSLCGKLVLSKEEWQILHGVLLSADDPGPLFRFFKFVNKGAK